MPRRIRKSRAQNQRWDHMVASLRLMNFAANNVRLYPPTHGEVLGVVGKLHETLTPILEEQEDIGYGFMEEVLYLEGSMTLEETAANPVLVDRFARCKVKYVTFMKGLTPDDLSSFFQILNAEAVKPSNVTAARQLNEKGIKTVHIVEADPDETGRSKKGRKKTLLDWYRKAAETLADAQAQLRDNRGPLGGAVELKGLYRLVEDMTATMRGKGHEPYLLLPLLAAGIDPHVAHGVNVAVLSCALAELYGLNSGQVNDLCAAAFLHDQGRIIIPPEWTQDPAPLSEAERRVARSHCDWGFLMLLRNPDLPPQAALLAAEHHRHAVGGGAYRPDTLQRLLALADRYDVGGLGDRHYWRRPRKDRVVASVLRGRAGPWGPVLPKLLAQCVGLFPVGCLVRLGDGRRGIVVRPNGAHPGRPKVYMFDETPKDEEAPPVVVDTAELDESGLRFKNEVAAAIDPPPGLDLGRVVDAKKEALLSYEL